MVILAVCVTTWWLLNGPPPAAQQTVRIEALRTALAAGAGVGGAITVMLAFRRQRHNEIVAIQNKHDADERRVTELYTKAVEHLGSDKGAVRLGALYALERVAQAEVAQRQTIVNVICAYLRMPYSYSQDSYSTKDADQSNPATNSVQDSEYWGERQVRLAAQSILSKHLRDPESAKKRGDSEPAFWPDIDLNLSGAALFRLDFRNIKSSEMNFIEATFHEEALFDETEFPPTASFNKARFQKNVRFDHAVFTDDAIFNSAVFEDESSFEYTTFKGNANFNKVRFEGYASLPAIFERGAYFQGASFGRGVNFMGTHFPYSCDFYEAKFYDGAQFSKAVLNGAGFREAYIESANFSEAQFTQYASFRQTVFGGGVARFDGAEFTNNVKFNGAKFDTEGSFIGAKFGGSAAFYSVTFDKDIEFREAIFKGSAHFPDATFSADSNFSHCDFQEGAHFRKSAFEGSVRFDGVKFQKETQFEHVRFAYIDRINMYDATVADVTGDHHWPPGWKVLARPNEIGLLIKCALPKNFDSQVR